MTSSPFKTTGFSRGLSINCWLRLLGGFVLLVLSGSLAAQQCSDIGDVDFRNATVQLKPIQDWPLSKLEFHNGAFDEKDGRNGESAGNWRYEIEKDTILDPTPQTTIRFLQILRDHVSGTGSFTCLVGFSCSQGKVKNVFQQCGELMKVESLTPQSLQLEFAERKQSDPYCCPSIKTKRSFVWDPSSSTYVEPPRQPVP